MDLILNVEDFDVDSKFERTVNVSVPKKTRNNGTLYAYIFLHHAGILPWQDGKQVHVVSTLTTYMIPKPEEINLLTGESATQVRVVTGHCSGLLSLVQSLCACLLMSA